MPGQYGYPMPYPPTPHGYTPYPPYAPQMMMYGTPRTNALPEPSRTSSAASPVPITTTVTTGKRKRKSNAEAPQGRGSGDRDSDPEGSGSDRPRAQPTQSASAASLVDLKKRTKTQRACDSCRSRKIRSANFVIIQSEHPHLSFPPPHVVIVDIHN